MVFVIFMLLRGCLDVWITFIVIFMCICNLLVVCCGFALPYSVGGFMLASDSFVIALVGDSLLGFCPLMLFECISFYGCLV